jgi:monothiol glutaredoxin
MSENSSPPPARDGAHPLAERIRQTIETDDVVVFIKGTPQMVMCGNSERALDALRAVGTGFTAVDVLADPQIRQELTALSRWPTIPQLFVGGELIGGADIAEELASSGDLESKLDEKLGDSWRATAGREEVVEVGSGPGPSRLVQ